MLKPVTVGYTIYNKAHLLPQIVEGVKSCFGPEDEKIFFYDNCTDGSMTLGRKLYPTARHLFSVEDLFEIKANNEILREAKNDTIILFQDDILCYDKAIKYKIDLLQKFYKDDLGLIGGRDGFELRDATFPEKVVDKYSSWLHKKGYETMLKNGEFREKTFVNRGPLVFTKQLIEKVGYLDEAYYPQFCDDMDYCARARYKFGLKNIVMQVYCESKLEWGSTRRKDTSLYKLTHNKHHKKNWSLFAERWTEDILNEKNIT